VQLCGSRRLRHRGKNLNLARIKHAEPIARIGRSGPEFNEERLTIAECLEYGADLTHTERKSMLLIRQRVSARAFGLVDLLEQLRGKNSPDEMIRILHGSTPELLTRLPIRCRREKRQD
jgi:hypothetical protein